MIGLQPASHVLVLDGEPSIRALIREVLEEAGYRVSVAAERGASLAVVKRVDPDLVVLDLVLGKEDLGWQVLQQVSLDPETADIPVVVCTGAMHMLRRVEDRLAPRGIRVLTKPFDVDELASAVGSGLRGSAPVDRPRA